MDAPSSSANEIWWYEYGTAIGTVHFGLGYAGVLKIQLPLKLHHHQSCPPHEQMEPPEVASLNSSLRKAIDRVLSCKTIEYPPPLVFRGSAFQVRVWQQIAQLKPGSRITYGNLARKLGNPGAARAVGSACGANPFPLVIPCHRVVSSSDIGGFSGDMEIKKFLLTRELHAQ